MFQSRLDSMGALRVRFTGLATGAAVLLAILVPSPWPSRADTGDHSEQGHHFVRISDGALTPGLVTMKPGEAIAWGNYSSKRARISFDREVARRIVCEAPGGFHLSDEALESNELRARQFASLCRLEPGEYTYRVVLYGATRGWIDSKGMAGRIVVSE
jgi:hypothetical protein